MDANRASALGEVAQPGTVWEQPRPRDSRRPRERSLLPTPASPQPSPSRPHPSPHARAPHPPADVPGTNVPAAPAPATSPAPAASGPPWCPWEPGVRSHLSSGRGVRSVGRSPASLPGSPGGHYPLPGGPVAPAEKRSPSSNFCPNGSSTGTKCVRQRAAPGVGCAPPEGPQPPSGSRADPARSGLQARGVTAGAGGCPPPLKQCHVVCVGLSDTLPGNGSSST